MIIDAVGSPGSSGTEPAPASAIVAPIAQNRRVRIGSSRSSASSGEPIVVEPPAAVRGYGVGGRGRLATGSALVEVAVASASESTGGSTAVTSPLGFAASATGARIPLIG